MIKYLVMDVDGTLTDGKIYIGNDGEVFKAFNAKDGYGLCITLPKTNIVPVIITGRTSQIVKNRCEELGIAEVHQGIRDKLGELRSITDDLSTVAYIGDDLNDFECMEAVKAAGGLIGCPADAAKEITAMSDFVADRNGGDGAVREFIDWIVGHAS